MSKNKYFAVNNKEVAEIMSMMLRQRYFIFEQENGIRYTFKRVDGIDEIFGKAMAVVNNIKNN